MSRIRVLRQAFHRSELLEVGDVVEWPAGVPVPKWAEVVATGTGPVVGEVPLEHAGAHGEGPTLPTEAQFAASVLEGEPVPRWTARPDSKPSDPPGPADVTPPDEVKRQQEKQKDKDEHPKRTPPPTPPKRR